MKYTIFQLLLITLTFFSCKSFTQKENIESHTDIKEYIDHVIQHYGMIGGAIAVIKDNDVVYKKYFGVQNVNSQKPIDENTLFRLHSLSKIFVATYIFQQIEEGQLTLNTEIGDILRDLPDKWKKIKWAKRIK